MSNNSAVTITGNCTRDPEMRYTPSGAAVASFGIVFNKRKKTESGQWEDGDPQFFDVSCWQSLAENVAESVKKGMRIIVSGELEYQTWETDGEKRNKVQIRAESVGPDLRWATADVTKVSGGSGGNSGGQAEPKTDNPYA